MPEAALSLTTPLQIPRLVPGTEWIRRAQEARGVFHVETEQDIVAAVVAARHGARRLHPAGSKGSKNGCYGAPDLELQSDRYNGVLSLDGHTVTVQAGATIGALNAVLRRHGLAVPTCGEWAGATVAGSVGTGSHGGSGRHGIHSTSLRAMRLITASGAPLEMRRGDPHFEHIGVSLGLLGVISTLTFECAQRFYLELETRVLPFEKYLLAHDSLTNENEFFSAIWIPTARRVITFAANRVPAPLRTARRMERYCIKTFLLNAASRKLNIDLVSDRFLARTVVDEGDRILAPIQDRSKRVHFLRFLSKDWKAMEGAVSQDRAVETLIALDRFLAGNGRGLTNPVGLRASAADEFSLSPCHGRSTYWIDLFYKGNGHFATGLRELLEGLDARCHWGKHVGLSAEYLRKQYPRINAFRDYRRAMDPEGLFENTFTRSFDL
jgi:FAD/FMN-containing dehydrogenase